MVKPLFSIIIPTLNEEHYLPKLLQDLSEQRKKNFEVIIVDASSIDATKKKAETFISSLSLQFLSAKKKHVASQRNQGASVAKGDYLIFLDADARVNSVFTSRLESLIAQTKGLLFLPYIIADKVSSKNKIIFALINSVIEVSQSVGRPLSCGGSIIIQKTLFEKLNGFDENFYLSEDHNLIQRARKLKAKAHVLRQIKVVFSLRRFEKDGEISVAYKYLQILIQTLVNGSVNEEKFAYEMGGHRYGLTTTERKQLKRLDMKEIIYKVSSFLN